MSLMLLCIDNGLDRSMASLSLRLSQAKPLYLIKTDSSDKYFQKSCLDGPDLEIPTGSEAWRPRTVTEAVLEAGVSLLANLSQRQAQPVNPPSVFRHPAFQS